MSSVCIRIYLSIYLYSYTPTHGISGLAVGVDCEIRDAPENDNPVNSGHDRVSMEVQLVIERE
jgi:hypothetical protein